MMTSQQLPHSSPQDARPLLAAQHIPMVTEPDPDPPPLARTPNAPWLELHPVRDELRAIWQLAAAHDQQKRHRQGQRDAGRPDVVPGTTGDGTRDAHSPRRPSAATAGTQPDPGRAAADDGSACAGA